MGSVGGKGAEVEGVERGFQPPPFHLSFEPKLSWHLQPFRVISTNTFIGRSGLAAEWTNQLLSLASSSSWSDIAFPWDRVRETDRGGQSFFFLLTHESF